jgi:preprotein translocase subunit SecF
MTMPPSTDRAAQSRRNRLLALVLAVIAVIFYVGIGLRWHH